MKWVGMIVVAVIWTAVITSNKYADHSLLGAVVSYLERH